MCESVSVRDESTLSCSRMNANICMFAHCTYVVDGGGFRMNRTVIAGFEARGVRNVVFVLVLIGTRIILFIALINVLLDKVSIVCLNEARAHHSLVGSTRC